MDHEHIYTNVVDSNCEKLFTGDQVKLFDMTGIVTFECGAFGISFEETIDWDKLSNQIEPVTGCHNSPRFVECDNFISFWELLWNYNCEEDICTVVQKIHSDKPYAADIEISDKNMDHEIEQLAKILDIPFCAISFVEKDRIDIRQFNVQQNDDIGCSEFVYTTVEGRSVLAYEFKNGYMLAGNTNIIKTLHDMIDRKGGTV